jgi:hypothetical protein
MLKEEGVLYLFIIIIIIILNFHGVLYTPNSKGIRFCLKEKNKFQVEIHNKSNDT